MARDVTPVSVRDGRLRERTALRGYEVSLNHTMTATGLGKYDANGNGTLDDLLAPQVGLWDLASQTRLADVTIPLDATEVDGYFWQPIERMTLPSGDYIVGTQIYAGQEPYLYRADLDYVTPVQPLTVGRRRSDVRIEFPNGTSTDDLFGDTWRYDRVHFNEVGLREHARRWHNAVLPIIVPEPSTAGSIWWALAWILWLRSGATTAS